MLASRSSENMQPIVQFKCWSDLICSPRNARLLILIAVTNEAVKDTKQDLSTLSRYKSAKQDISSIKRN